MNSVDGQEKRQYRRKCFAVNDDAFEGHCARIGVRTPAVDSGENSPHSILHYAMRGLEFTHRVSSGRVVMMRRVSRERVAACSRFMDSPLKLPSGRLCRDKHVVISPHLADF